MANNASLPAGDLEIGTIFSSGVEFDGQVSLNQPVLIHGSIKGTIVSQSDIFVSAEAKVEADVEARRISIKGTVAGNIQARERLELFKTARVSGSIVTGDMVVQSGALVNANCIMNASSAQGE